MKRSLIIAGVLVAVLTGCGAASASEAYDPSGDLYLGHINVPGRGTVQCVVYSPKAYQGGLSCDWGHAK